MSAEFNAPQNPTFTEQLNQRVDSARSALSRVAAAGLLVVGGATIVTGVETTIHPTVAYADTVDDALAAYPDRIMTCEHPNSEGVYSATGPCANYDWGPNHTTKLGDPSTNSSRGYGYRNCTDWVAWRIHDISGGAANVPEGLGDAKDWSAGFSANALSTMPAAGDIAVSTSGTYGHVAVVESISSDGKNMVISEYNHDEQGNGDQRTLPTNGTEFTKFINLGVQPSGSGGGGDATLADGKFISYNPDINPNDPRKVYEIVGGAPMYVDGDDAKQLPGWATAAIITTAQWDSLRQYPNDGTFISNVENGGVYEIVGGAPLYVSGDDARLMPGWAKSERAPGWDFMHYGHLRPYPADGTFVSNVQNGMVFEMVGGAPMYIPGDDTANFPGWVHAEVAPGWDFVNHQHVWPYPNDGKFISDDQTGKVYEVAGGAPLYVSGDDASYLPAWADAIKVPHQDIANYQSLRQYPVDDEYVSDVQTGMVYTTAGGAPLYVSGADTPYLPNWANALPVPHWDFTNRSDLRQFPADGTYLTDDLNGKVFVVAGGAPLYVEGWDNVGGSRPTALAGDWAIANQLLPYPQNGTLVRGFGSGKVFETENGAALLQPNGTGMPTIVDDWAIVNQLGATE